MKIYETDKQYWNIHFLDSMYSVRLYKNYDSIQELCKDMNCKRKDFELYKTTLT